MKFSHSLQFNAVPEWSSKYIAYTTLKKLIYTLQRNSLHSPGNDIESSQLLSNYSSVPGNNGDPSSVFLAALDAELKKIDEFYQAQEKIIFKSLEELVADMEDFENELNTATSFRGRNDSDFNDFSLNKSKRNRDRAGSGASADYGTTTDPETYTQAEEDNADYDDHEEGDINSDRGRSKSRGNALETTKSINEYLKSPRAQDVWNNLNRSASNLPPLMVLLSENRVILRKRVIGLYTTLSELKSYIELNETGFKKALKKFDKSLNTHLKDDYLTNLPLRSYVFKPSTKAKVDENLESLVSLYAMICNHGNGLELAKSELSIHLREHVVWERNTVWRDMIGLERKSQAANTTKDTVTNEKDNKKATFQFNISLKNPRIIKLISITVITIIFLNMSLFEDKQQQHCFSLVLCASLLWATETVPLFVTSLLVPVLVVSLKVLKNDDGSVMDAPSSSKYILSTMWNSVILLLLGGFTLAAALSKYQIAKLISTWILSKAGTSPSIVLLTIMGVALFASMWVSNVAAPVLCFSLIQPLLRTLPRGSQFIKSLILGIALASNIGGMASPIASPQNIIAIGAMDPPPSWAQWFIISLPVCVLSLLLIWVFLLITFNCNSHNTQLVAFRTIDDKFTLVQWYVAVVSIGTIFLWCIASRLESIFGEMGIIALLPLLLFFGPGLLTAEDFNNYPWNIVILAMGGTALGKAVSSSGLLATIAVSIQNHVEGFSLLGVTLTFGLLILTVATFVSHTVAALIIIPLVSEIGNKMPEPHPRLLIMASALLCSAAMGLPTSGFPNVTAICMTDEFGKPYLTVGTFITRGVPSSVIAYFIIVTIGYATMRIINF
ncbi:uncharacterized protein PRCAT00003998001 [Priceomyces carsonii]|uniref:uncharacterized protein n=1 Tax=Priceomyces carsonii TaxID=28549 RepID=UPI002ED88E12|nr:unnamed protein product [Priceomyces carsonii]